MVYQDQIFNPLLSSSYKNNTFIVDELVIKNFDEIISKWNIKYLIYYRTQNKVYGYVKWASPIPTKYINNKGNFEWYSTTLSSNIIEEYFKSFDTYVEYGDVPKMGRPTQNQKIQGRTIERVIQENTNIKPINSIPVIPSYQPQFEEPQPSIQEATKRLEDTCNHFFDNETKTKQLINELNDDTNKLSIEINDLKVINKRQNDIIKSLEYKLTSYEDLQTKLEDLTQKLLTKDIEHRYMEDKLNTLTNEIAQLKTSKEQSLTSLQRNIINLKNRPKQIIQIQPAPPLQPSPEIYQKESSPILPIAIEEVKLQQNQSPRYNKIQTVSSLPSSAKNNDIVIYNNEYWVRYARQWNPCADYAPEDYGELWYSKEGVKKYNIDQWINI